MDLKLSRRYKRWRHGRGFGIHSPFAYDFITRTLRERLPYYAYDAIDTMPCCLAARRRLRLIFRIAVRFNPHAAAIVGSTDSRMQRAVLKSVRHDMQIAFSHDDADFVIVNDCAESRIVPAPRAVYVFPDLKPGASAACDSLWEAVTAGMRFDNGRGFTVIVTSPKLPRQQFEAKF